MSSGGAFKLLSNDGKQDNMIMATRYLNERLKEIQSLKSRNPRITDPTPSIADIEHTHVLFVKAHFKPYVALAYEYQIVQASSQVLGSQVQFSIPLYGDLIHDMVFHCKLSAVSAKNTGAGDRLIKYIDYPGEKLCKNTEFTVNGNFLDAYESEMYPFYREYSLQPNKKVGYDRMMGQQIPINAEILSAGGRNGTVQSTLVTNGHQTPKASQPELDLWIPILIWFAQDVRLSLLSVAIPSGQRFLTINLANADELLQHVGTNESDDNPVANPVNVPSITTCELYVNNIFVNPEIHSIIIKKIGFNLIRVYRYQKITLNKNEDHLLLSRLKWPIETLYVGGRPIANNNKNNVGYAKNWHKFSFQTDVKTPSGSQDTNAYFWGAFAHDPAQADDYTAALTRSDGRPHGLNFATYLGVAGTTVLTVTQINTVLSRNGYLPLSGTFAAPATPTNAEIRAASPSTGSVMSYKTEAGAFDTIGIEAHGVELYKKYPSKFYNAYTSWHFGGDKVQTPVDSGKYMIPFNLYPGTYQPSGHINVSRSREFYLNYTSSLIDINNQVEMMVIAVAINFLLITDGSAVLRYAT